MIITCMETLTISLSNEFLGSKVTPRSFTSSTAEKEIQRNDTGKFGVFLVCF